MKAKRRDKMTSETSEGTTKEDTVKSLDLRRPRPRQINVIFINKSRDIDARIQCIFAISS